MSDLFFRRLERLAEPEYQALLSQCLHGVERECLRVDAQGHLALTPHPKGLGSALTHPQITTDYSEALLEFITGTHQEPQQMLQELEHIHRFAFSQLAHEYLWSASMPCPLPEEAQIPIAEYGTSNLGRLKHVYRRGLALRYGKTMQCIAGIHYNFSLPPAIWGLLQQQMGDTQLAQAFQSERYIGLIRNFRRYSWLLMYLFGASPALDRGFLRDRTHQLEVLDDQTLYLPYATSLRMSDLGYQNNAQAGLTPCYDDLDSYTDSLSRAVSTPYPPYVAQGCQQNGEWIQLNTNILQIENEYYSTIRPKRVAHPGERPLHALRTRGIQYVEVRCLDINPFLPLGLDRDEAYFMTSFLLYCALEDSPRLVKTDCGACSQNFLTVVREGRRPGLTLQRYGQTVPLTEWAEALLQAMEPVARLLDQGRDRADYTQALAAQRAKVADTRLTPSAQVLACLQTQHLSFTDFAQQQSVKHAAFFQSHPLDEPTRLACLAQVERSLQEQAALEAADTLSFNDFVAAYQSIL